MSVLSGSPILVGFCEECDLTVLVMRQQLARLRRNPRQPQLVAEVARLLHSLHGTAEMLRLDRLGRIADLQEQYWTRLSLQPNCSAADLQLATELFELLVVHLDDLKQQDREPEEWLETARALVQRDATEEPIDDLSIEEAIPPAPVPELLIDSTLEQNEPVAVPGTGNPRPADWCRYDLATISPDHLSLFRNEAEDHLQRIQNALAEAKANDDSFPIALQILRRSVHSLKGSAGAIGLRTASRWAHKLEDLLEAIGRPQQIRESADLNLLQRGIDLLQDLIFRPETLPDVAEAVSQLMSSPAWPGSPVKEISVSERVSATEPLSAEEAETVAVAVAAMRATAADADAAEIETAGDAVVSGATPRPDQTSADKVASPQQAVRAGTTPDSDSERVRVSRAQLDALLELNGDWLMTRSTLQQRLQQLQQQLQLLNGSCTQFRRLTQDLSAAPQLSHPAGSRAWSDPSFRQRDLLRITAARRTAPVTRFTASRIDSEFDPLEMDQYNDLHLLSRGLTESTADITAVAADLGQLLQEVGSLLGEQDRLARESQQHLMQMRLVSFDRLKLRLERAVREAVHSQQKQVAFEFIADGVELEKTLLDAVTDPLLHLVRNAVDHGIETAPERVAAGKASIGRVCVAAAFEGAQVVITITDDGRGLDLNRIRQTAVQRGLFSAEDAARLRDDEATELIFRTGFSTATRVSELSGRGVGLDIVAHQVERQGGQVVTVNHPGQGCGFVLRLPLKMTTTRALLVEAAGALFAIPQPAAIQVLRSEPSELQQTPHGLAIGLGDRSLRADWLHDSLCLPRSDSAQRTVYGVVLQAGSQHLVTLVDRIHGAREIVVKPAGACLPRVPGLMGATLLGDGTVVPILDPSALVQSGLLSQRSGPLGVRADAAEIGLAVQNETDATAPAERTGPPLIAIVDDSISVRKVTSRRLTAAGYRVLEAVDGVQAMQFVNQQGAQPDLWILDVEMPRMDGFELLATLRQRESSRLVPIVMSTSRGGEKHRQKAFELGANAYLVKPATEDELIETVKEWLAASIGTEASAIGAGVSR